VTSAVSGHFAVGQMRRRHKCALGDDEVKSTFLQVRRRHERDFTFEQVSRVQIAYDYDRVA